MRAALKLLLLVTTACASGGGRSTADSAPGGPVVWPPGRYLASAELAYTSGAVRTGTSPRRLVQAEVYIAPEGSVTLTSGEGSCQERAAKGADVRRFSCGDAIFQLTIDGGTIRGTATAPVTYWVSGWSQCTRWMTGADGTRQCATMEEHPEEQRTARVTGRLAVVVAS